MTLLTHGWIGGQNSVRRTRKKRQYVCHNTEEGKCMNEIICPCTLKQVGESYMFGNIV